MEMYRGGTWLPRVCAAQHTRALFGAAKRRAVLAQVHARLVQLRIVSAHSNPARRERRARAEAARHGGPAQHADRL